MKRKKMKQRMPPKEKKQEPEEDKRIDAHGPPLIKKGWSMFSLKTLFKFKTQTTDFARPKSQVSIDN